MPLKSLKLKDKIILIIFSIAWVALLAQVGKSFISHEIVGEIVGVICGISMSFISLHAYKNLTSQ